MIKQNELALRNIIASIHDTNTTLLNEVDNLVSMYTIHSEKRVLVLSTYNISLQ